MSEKEDKKENEKECKTEVKKWTELTDDIRKKIETQYSEVLDYLKNINIDTLPKNIKEEFKKIETLEKINEELRNANKHLKHSLEEAKSTYESHVFTFKEKASSLAEKAKEEIEKFKSNHLNKSKKEMEETKKYKSSDILLAILEPINNIKMAIEVGKKQDLPDLKSYLIGFQMLVNQLDQAMEEEGVIAIKPKVGDKFDPHYHQAISTIDDHKRAGKIVEVKKEGYMLHDRLLIPSRVVVAK